MSFTFPTNPSVDDTIELNGKTFKWTVNGTWDRVTVTTSGGTTSARTHYQPDFYSMDISRTIDNVSDTVLYGLNVATAKSIGFVNSGNNMLMTCTNNDTVYMLDLATAYDPSTASYNGTNSLLTTSQDTLPYESQMDSTGTKLYVMGNKGDDINQYSLSTAWDLTTATFVANKTIKGSGITAESSPNGFQMSDDGTRVFITGTGKDTIYALDLTTAWDITTMVPDATEWQGLDTYSGGGGMSVAPDGLTFWAQSPGDSSFRYAQQWIMDSYWDIASAKPAGVWMMVPYYYRDSVNSPTATVTGITDTTWDNQNLVQTLWHPTEKKLWFYHGAYNNYFTEVTWS